MGRQCLARYAGALSRCLAVRDATPAERFVDVDYRAVARDPVGEVRRIYAAVGLPLTPAAEAAMRAWVAKNPREHRPPHEYSMETFGYTREGIERAFAAYRARFITRGRRAMSSFVLVHGAWHGAWCWEKVVPLLAARGHAVRAIDLPGHGRDPKPPGAVTWDDYMDRMREAIEASGEPPILVGHSLGGAVITGAADR